MTKLISLICLLTAMYSISYADTTDIDAANKLLARTVNMGYTFDAPQEGKWGNVLGEEELKNIKSAGFTAVRVPIQWCTRMDSIAPYAISKTFFDRIDQVIHQALKYQLAIIVENCIDEQLMADPEKYKNRFLALWEQLSAHYASYPSQVMFEIMAEPHAKLDNLWQDYFTNVLAIIRKNNASRPVIIGPRFYNSLYYLQSLHLPDNDHHIIVTFHLYEPMKFAMQGEAWFPIGKPMEWVGTKWMGTPEEKKFITDKMDIVRKWADEHKRPIFMGEFGVSDHADLESRARFLAFYREQAEQRHFSWGVWCYNTGFSLHDKNTGQWYKELLTALIP